MHLLNAYANYITQKHYGKWQEWMAVNFQHKSSYV